MLHLALVLAVGEVADFIWLCCFLFASIYPQCLTSSVASLLRAPDSPPTLSKCMYIC